MLSDLIRRYFAACVAVPVLVLPGCGTNGPKTRVRADLSGPKPAALTFLRAIEQGDAQTAKDASVGTPQDKQFVDGMVALLDGLKAYDRALLSRFGQQAAAADVDLKQAILTLAQDPLARIEDGIVREGPDTAEIDPAFHGVRLTARPPIYVRKDKGLWRVDLPATARQDPRLDPAVAKRYLAAGKALRDAARQIAFGRYKTFAEAERAIDVQLPPEPSASRE